MRIIHLALVVRIDRLRLELCITLLNHELVLEDLRHLANRRPPLCLVMLHSRIRLIIVVLALLNYTAVNVCCGF